MARYELRWCSSVICSVDTFFVVVGSNDPLTFVDGSNRSIMNVHVYLLLLHSYCLARCRLHHYYCLQLLWFTHHYYLYQFSLLLLLLLLLLCSLCLRSFSLSDSDQFLVLRPLLVLVLRTGAPAKVGGCKSVLEPGSWSTPLVVHPFVVSSMMELRHREGTMVGD